MKIKCMSLEDGTNDISQMMNFGVSTLVMIYSNQVILEIIRKPHMEKCDNNWISSRYFDLQILENIETYW